MNRILFLNFKRFLVNLVFLGATQGMIFGQAIKVKGKITGQDQGEPLIGATVTIKGTTVGVVSDVNGHFSISVPSTDDTLVVAYVGYLQEQIPVGDQTEFLITLMPDIVQLSDVVIIGYGSQKKEDLTGAVTVVGAEEMERNKPTTLTQALQGIAPGVSVTNSSGQPGQTASVKIRGVGSISGSAEPLYVVDGVVTDNPYVINNINPMDIESISILKDASSAAIYGARGANGVIVVTTKQAKGGKTAVSLSSYWGVAALPNVYDVMNADEYAAFTEAAWTQSKVENPSLSVPLFYTDSARTYSGAEDNNWLDLITQKGLRQSYNLSVSSGSEKSTVYFGANYYKEEGVLINTGYERYSGRLNSTISPKKWLTIGESLNYNHGFYQFTSHKGENPWRLATIASPFMKVYDENNVGGFAGPEDSITGPNDKSNPYAEQKLNNNQQKVEQLIGNAFAELKPIKGLTYRFSVGLNLRKEYYYRYSPEYELARAWSNPSASLSESYGNSITWLIDNTVDYQKSFKNHNMTVMLGQSAESNNFRDLSVDGLDLAYDGKDVMSTAQTISFAGGGEYDFRQTSYFGRLLYDFKGRYLLTATLRRDANSKFGPENRVGYFPSFSLGWKLNEDFLHQIDEISMLKLRVGWGQTGNSNFGSYQYIDRITNTLESRYPFGTSEEVYYAGTVTRSFANPYIKWEATEMTNIGADINLFRNRLQFTAEYYHKKQEDMILELEQYHFMGRQQEDARQPVNSGSMVNKGFEFSLTFKKLEGKFNYSISTNLTTVNNEVIALPSGEPILHGYTISQEGESVGSFYGYVADGILQESDFDSTGTLIYAPNYNSATPGDIKFLDINGDSTINDADRKIIGSPIPDLIYGLSVNLNYGNWDFNVMFQGVHGNEIYNLRKSEIGLATEPDTKNWNRLREVSNYWTPENPVNDQTKASVYDKNDNNRMSTWFVEDGSYLRLKTIQIGYTLPRKWTGDGNVRIYASGTNLLTFTKYSGLDPEINSSNVIYSGFDSGNYPAPRTFIGGLEINF